MKQDTTFAVSQRMWTAILFFLSFFIWQLCFRMFYGGEIPVVEDALAYFNQIGFFTDSLSKGVFPLWVPDQYFGFPHDFYLLRIGGFNPAYILLVLARLMNLPYTFSYILFMSSYYFLGCLGFYRILRLIVKHKAASVIGFFLLYFSCLGTRIFDSYFILVVTPLIWSVFFMIRFCLIPSRKLFLRLVFVLMILFGTYIPFYAVLSLGIGAVVWCCVFFDRVLSLARRLGSFFRAHWFITLFGVAALSASLMPGLMFFQNASHGDVVMPGRHGGVDEQESSSVPYKFTARWAILEELAFSLDFRDIRRMRFAVLFFSILTWVIFILGSLTRITRNGFFILMWLGLLFLLGIPKDIPVYPYLVQTFSFFKYFRNLHFFLWMAILPLFIFFCALQLKQIFSWLDEKHNNGIKIILIGVVHVLVGLLAAHFLIPLTMSYIALIFSFFGFCLYASKEGFRKLALILFLCAIAGEFYSVYIHAASFYWGRPVKYDESGFMRELSERDLSEIDNQKRVKFYVISNNIYQVSQMVTPEIFWRYARDIFRWYDAAENIVTDEQQMPSLLKNAFDPQATMCLLDGKAFTSSGENFKKPYLNIIKTSSNKIVVSVKSPQEGVLVFNEVYHPDWHVFIDGSETGVYQANGAFCGAIIPEGDHRVEFVFGGWHRRASAGLLFGLYYGLGFGLLFFSFRKK